RQIEVWAPLPTKANPFIPPNKPLTKIAALLAKHKGEQTWTETVVSDSLFHGAYISMAPGEKTPRRFHQDNRAFWIVQDGQIRFTIEGQIDERTDTDPPVDLRPFRRRGNLRRPGLCRRRGAGSRRRRPSCSHIPGP